MENLLCLRGSETIQKFSLAKGGLASSLHMPCLQCVPSSLPREKPFSCRAPYRVAVVLSCWLALELLLALGYVSCELPALLEVCGCPNHTPGMALSLLNPFPLQDSKEL